MAERHERIEPVGLAVFNQGWGEQIGCGTRMEVEEVAADGDAKVLLAFVFKGPVGQVRKGEISSGLIGFGEPAFMGQGGSFCHRA